MLIAISVISVSLLFILGFGIWCCLKVSSDNDNKKGGK